MAAMGMSKGIYRINCFENAIQLQLNQNTHYKILTSTSAVSYLCKKTIHLYFTSTYFFSYGDLDRDLDLATPVLGDFERVTGLPPKIRTDIA